MLRQRVIRHGGPEVLAFGPADTPLAGPGQVLIRVERAGVALSDVLMRQGRYPGGPRAPFTPGWDAVGRVEAVGEGADPALFGRRVAALVFLGGYASHAVADDRFVVPVPDTVSSDAAACLILNYMTAWQMLTRLVELKPGARVLVRGAAGGVGSAALDIARLRGLFAWGVSRPAKSATVARFGATWLGAPAMKGLAASLGGFDLVLDPVGGAATRVALGLLAPGGTVVTYGFTGFPPALLGPSLAWRMVVSKLGGAGGRRSLFHRYSRMTRDDPAAWRDDLGTLFDALAVGRLDPLVADVLPLSDAAEAHRRLEAFEVEGKLLLDPAL